MSCPPKYQSLINNALANNDDVDYVLIEPGTYEEQLIINIPQIRNPFDWKQLENTIKFTFRDYWKCYPADGGGKIYLENIKITNGTRSGIYINNSLYFFINACLSEIILFVRQYK